jgi:hypothetical protein
MQNLRSFGLIQTVKISTQDLDRILEIRSKSERVEKHTGVVNYRYSKKEMNWLVEKLGLTGTITGGNFFETVNPFHVHTDTGKAKDLGNLKPKWNIVVPLSEQEDFNTVIFNQQWNGDASHFMIGSIYKYWPDPVYNLRKTDYTGVEGLTSIPFDEDDYLNYLTHLPYETVQGLSIKKVIPWSIGEVLIFDSTLLHCSSKFDGIKSGLTVLVSNV